MLRTIKSKTIFTLFVATFGTLGILFFLISYDFEKLAKSQFKTSSTMLSSAIFQTIKSSMSSGDPMLIAAAIQDASATHLCSLSGNSIKNNVMGGNLQRDFFPYAF